MKLHVFEIFDAVHGSIYSDEESLRKECEGFTWDSREVKPGYLFLALPGERVDGNDFVAKAIMAGAGCVIATRPLTPAGEAIAGEFACPVITVEDGQKALNDLAAFWRNRLHALVVGVTGSTGKTSTKDLLKSLLSQRYKVTATQGNHNNELGVPYTILSADEDCEVLVVEMGMRGLGQIEQLCKIVQPSIGVVTNVGVCHMELLGSQENIARAKGELLAALPRTGLAVVNADDKFTDFMLEESGVLNKRVLVSKFGRGQTADTHVTGRSLGADACGTFTLQLGMAAPFNVKVGLPGEHNVMNALAACCVGNYLGLSSEMIAKGLAEASASAMRMEITTAKTGVTFINDAYNANPDSMQASLKTLASMNCPGRRIAVLGDMGELGDDEAWQHKRVGGFAARSRLDYLLCVGELSSNIASGAAEAGMPQETIEHVATVDEAISRLRENLGSGDTVLVKASRFMGMERIVKELSE